MAAETMSASYEQASAQYSEIVRLVADHHAAVESVDDDRADEIMQEMHENALSVEVRTDWYSPGSEPEVTDFAILLCTGGPAVRIRGELNEWHEPGRAWLEHQDWGTPWTEVVNGPSSGVSMDVLLAYARQFYFGS